MVISIIGCGWFGLELGKSLVADGYSVNGATTTAGKLNSLQEAGMAPYHIQIAAQQEHLADASFFNCDVLVITIPPKVHLHGADDYLLIQKRLIELAAAHSTKKIVFISSTSVYGDVCSNVDEDTLPAADTLSGQTLLRAESLYASTHAFRTTVLRFGGLVGPGRDPGRFFAGKRDIANGQAPVNLIHLQDCVGITREIINKDLFGVTINACSPHHPSRKEFYTHASRQSGLAVPDFKDELLGWKVVSSKIIPHHLRYDFQFSNWLT